MPKIRRIKLHLLSAVAISCLCSGAKSQTLSAVSGRSSTLDYSALPSDADLHHRTKWSNGEFIYVDDDAGAPSLYIFDASGRRKFETMLQIPGVQSVRIDDFAAAPDGSVWTGGSATSASGQRGFFLAHLNESGTAELVQSPDYRPHAITVMGDGTVWAVGYGISRDASGGTNVDKEKDILRHFDASGRFLSSSIPLSSVGLPRAYGSFLAATETTIGWYSSARGQGAYVELSTDMKVLSTFPEVPGLESKAEHVEGFAVTPRGDPFISVVHANGAGNAMDLYKLDRTSKTWVEVKSFPHLRGAPLRFEGNNGEFLVFTGSPDKATLQQYQISEVRP